MDLELRKQLCEALGYRLFFVGNGYLYHEVIAPNDPPFALEPDQARLWEQVPFGRICEKDALALAALESDPGVFWPMFEKWRLERGLNYECGSDSRGSSLAAGDEPLERLHFFKILDGYYNDFTEREESDELLIAGCRAWLDAIKAIGGAK